MREFMAVAKALADESRVRLLLALRSGERCVCELNELLDLAPSTVSKHLSILHQARLVEARKEGRWIHYRLADDGPTAARTAIRWVRHCLARDPVVRADARKDRCIHKAACERRKAEAAS